MPEGMKVMLMYTGIFEDLKQMMGFETLAYATADDPELIDDILEQLTRIAEYTVGLAAAHPATGAVFYGEDMGFNTGTLLSPAFMKQHVIPRHKRIADACHAHGKPFLLHSCGNVIALMDDLIEAVGIDAKHSFEDKILPVEEWYARWGDRIGIIGGVDMDKLAQLLVNVSKMLYENQWICELDLNPIVAYEKGYLAVDVRVIRCDEGEKK